MELGVSRDGHTRFSLRTAGFGTLVFEGRACPTRFLVAHAKVLDTVVRQQAIDVFQVGTIGHWAVVEFPDDFLGAGQSLFPRAQGPPDRGALPRTCRWPIEDGSPRVLAFEELLLGPETRDSGAAVQGKDTERELHVLWEDRVGQVREKVWGLCVG